MICPACAAAADAAPGTGHPADACDDHGRDIRACGCGHGAETPPNAPHDPQEQQP